MLEVLPIVFHREVKPFPIWFYLPLLYNYVSLHILVLLVVLIPMSPRTSKTEFVCKSYRSFRIALFLSFGGRIIRPKMGRIFREADIPALRGTDNPALKWFFG